MANQEPNFLTISNLQNADKYIIPIYQRPYAWGDEEVLQLLNDIKTAQGDTKTAEGDTKTAQGDTKTNYYIGTLVVYQRENNTFEVIDGQQRLTTLFIILAALGKKTEENIRLSFDARPKSMEIFKNLANSKENSSIVHAFETVKSWFETEKIASIDFLNQIKILQVEVPQDTDLNHYFEIMNTRGEQLEKHEILKARCMNGLKNEEEKQLFAKIWDACADMGEYVQSKFENDLFSVFSSQADFKKLALTCNETEPKTETTTTETQNSPEIFGIKLQKISEEEKEMLKSKGGKGEKFSSIINFPNFLLHVLQIQVGEITLDDSKLLTEFKESPGEEFVQEFAYNLLKIRFLFDNYIVKRKEKDDDDKDEEIGNWSLKKCEYKPDDKNKYPYNNTFVAEQKQIVMLLSMFQVSYSGQTYKHWLNEALKWLFKKETIEAKCYINKLEKLAEDKFVEIAKDKATFSAIKYPNFQVFVFNYLDYLIWRKERPSDFYFTVRNSVEHFYPQNPESPNEKWSDENLHSFGNLCLISRSENSSLNNDLPAAKRNYYRAKRISSLKQAKMFEKFDEKLDKEGWTTEKAQAHQDEMLNLLFPEHCAGTNH